MSELTDDERETLMSAVIAKMVNREVQVVPVVESIKAAAYRAGQEAASETFIKLADDHLYGLKLHDVPMPDVFRARAAELKETP